MLDVDEYQIDRYNELSWRCHACGREVKVQIDPHRKMVTFICERCCRIVEASIGMVQSLHEIRFLLPEALLYPFWDHP